MIDAGSLRDDESVRVAQQKRERYLPRGGCMSRSDLAQHTARGALWIEGRRGLTERRVGNHRNPALDAPRQDAVLDRAFLQVVEHLVAGRAAGPRNRRDLLQIRSEE